MRPGERPDDAVNDFTTLAKQNINVDIIIQSVTGTSKTSISFSVKTEDLKRTVEVLEEYKDALDYEQIETENRLAKVSIVGSGMISNPGVAAEMFAVLAEKHPGQNGQHIRNQSFDCRQRRRYGESR